MRKAAQDQRVSEEARRLDEGMRDFTSYMLYRAWTKAAPDVNRVLAGFGLRRSSYSALVVTLGEPGLKQGRLADALSIEQPNLVQVIDELENQGLIERRKSPDDRRAYALHPTQKGRVLEQRVTAAFKETDSALTSGLSGEEIALLHNMLRRIETPGKA